jgi:inorganic pyrophosphatase
MSAYTSRPHGEANTTEWALYFEENGAPVSPFHDIPVWVDKEKGIANMVVEIPRGTTAKLEINKANPFNPIKQDVKDGKLRQVTYRGGYPFNYGAIPQTWEDPSVTDADTNAKGDNDPLDVCDISTNQGVTGQIKQVKVLGVWAMLDAGETDWKVLVIDVADPKADKVNSIEDAKREFPGAVEDVFEFLENYKTPAKNQFAFDGKLLDKAKAVSVIDHTHEYWKKLASLSAADATTKKIALHNTKLSNSSSVQGDEAKKLAKY